MWWRRLFVGLAVVVAAFGLTGRALGGAALPVAPAQQAQELPEPQPPEESGTAAADSTLTWSVRPTPSAEEPERPNYAYDLAPGATVRDSIRVRNFGTEALPLAIYASDALTTATGVLDLLPAGEEPTDVGAWTVLDATNVEVPPQGFVDVQFTLVVPADAEPGDHTGGIVTSYRTPSEDESGQPVVLDRRLGSRIHVRVDGELVPRLEVSDVEVSYSGTANPLGTGTLHVDYVVTNVGNVRLGAAPTVVVPGRLGFPGREVALDRMPELLPGNSLGFTVDVPAVWPTVRTTAEVVLDPVPTREGDDFGSDVPTATASVSTWSVPWSQVGAVLVVVGVPLWVWRSRRRRRRREAALVQQVERTTAIVTEAVQTALAAQRAGAEEAETGKVYDNVS